MAQASNRAGFGSLRRKARPYGKTGQALWSSRYFGLASRRLLAALMLLSVLMLMYQLGSKNTVLMDLMNDALARPFNDTPFDTFFINDKVTTFMENHKRNCVAGRVLFAAFLGTFQMSVGFGACMTNAGAAFVAADEEINRKKYQFQFLSYNWAYGQLGDFFDDFTLGTGCPLFRNLSRSEVAPLSQNTAFSVWYENGTVVLSSPGSVLVMLVSPEYNRMRGALERMQRYRGTDYFFIKKSGLMKALWQPKAQLKDLLRKLWRNLVDENLRFFGVHVRRGNKLLIEAKEVPLHRFVAKVQEVCRVAGSRCPKNIFLMHDELWVFDKFQSMLNGTFQLYNFRTLLKRSQVLWDDDTVREMEEPPEGAKPLPRTKQLIVELTLLSLSDQIICTYSSNVCRTAALLRGSHSGDVQSLDVPAWYPW